MESDKQKFKNEFKKRLYIFVIKMIKFIDRQPKNSVMDVMGKQLLRSSTSVIANYIEASSASSTKDFINFFTYSLKSANESKVWICLLKDTRTNEKQKQKQELEELLKELTEIANVIATSILTLKGKKKK